MIVVFPLSSPSAHLRCRGAAETPLLALLGLGLFCWIFLTNSLPAKRELAGRLAQIERYSAEDGHLSRLKEELAEEEGLARAVREDAVVRRALFLLEHPTAPENAPEHLLPTFAMNLPEEPENLVEEEPPVEAELIFEDGTEAEAVGGSGGAAGGEPGETPTPNENEEQEPRTDEPRGNADRSRDLRTSEKTVVSPGVERPKTSGKPKANEKPKADDKSARAKAQTEAPKNEPRRTTPSTKPQLKSGSTPSDEARRGAVAGAGKGPSKAPARPSTARPANPQAPRATGSFEVPSFLRG
jgi:hypothetical protein